MADVANGSVSSIVVMANVIFYAELDGLGFLTVLTTFLVFMIFNVIREGCSRGMREPIVMATVS